jgi:cell division protein FtsN
MIKKIIGAIGLVGGLGLALLLLLYFLTPPGEAPVPEPTPAVQPQGGGRPALETPPPAATPDSPPVVPAATEPPKDAPGDVPAAAPAPAPAPPVAAVPAPEPPPQEKEVAPAPPAQPQKEHGLLAGRFRTYGQAKKRMTQITKQNIPAFIRKQGKYYEVWAGPFASPQEAARAQKSLKAAMKIAVQQKKIAVPVPK